MPFKIIQTVENGKVFLEVVPSKWERNGVSFWPSFGLSAKQKDEHSEPDSTFFQVPCKLKRANLETFRKALEMLEYMRDEDDTDNTDYITQSKGRHLLKRKGESAIKSVQINPDLSSLVATESGKNMAPLQMLEVQIGMNAVESHEVDESLILNDTQQMMLDDIIQNPLDSNRPQAYESHRQQPAPFVYAQQYNPQENTTNKNKIPATFSQQTRQISDAPTNKMFIVSTPTLRDVNAYDQSIGDLNFSQYTSTNESTFDSISTEISKFKREIEIRLNANDEKFEKLTHEVVSMKIMMESFFNSISERRPESLPPTKDGQAADVITHEPVQTIEQMDKFEKDLNISSFRFSLKQYWVAKMGTDVGKGMGRKKIAFSLAEEMFHRDIFLQFSWTGNSYDSLYPTGKVSLQKYPNVIQLFWEIVNTADKTYDDATNKEFFKSVMYKAKYRSATLGKDQAKRKRSSGKMRPSNLKYKRREKIINCNEVDDSPCEGMLEIELQNVDNDETGTQSVEQN